jgi:hypothetical protein
MNKKILVLSITLLTLVMLTTPLVSARGVRRNISQDFTATVIICDPSTTPAGSFTPGTTKYVGPKNSAVPPNPANPDDRLYHLQSGSIFFGVIDSDQLGMGTMESTQIIGLMNEEAGKGWGMFKWKWEFDNLICKGTIEGVYKGEQTLEFPTMSMEGSALLCKGTGDLKNVKIAVTSYVGTLNVLEFTTTGFSATGEGTMWGWN